jgi:hypothetical protein
MKKKVKNRVANRAERKLNRERGAIDELVSSVNQRHNMVEGNHHLRRELPKHLSEETAPELSDEEVAVFIEFFQILDEWDRQSQPSGNSSQMSQSEET